MIQFKPHHNTIAVSSRLFALVLCCEYGTDFEWSTSTPVFRYSLFHHLVVKIQTRTNTTSILCPRGGANKPLYMRDTSQPARRWADRDGV